MASNVMRGAARGKRLGVEADMARLRGHARAPRGDRRPARQIEAALAGDMRIGIERDVGERQPLADEEGMGLQMRVHQVERGVARGTLARDQRALRRAELVLADEGAPEAQRRDIGLVTILFEELYKFCLGLIVSGNAVPRPCCVLH